MVDVFTKLKRLLEEILKSQYRPLLTSLVKTIVLSLPETKASERTIPISYMDHIECFRADYLFLELLEISRLNVTNMVAILMW